MRYLLDTCAVSGLQKPKPKQGVINFLGGLDLRAALLSVITLVELRKGIYLLSPGKKIDHLMTWLVGLERQFNDSMLSADLGTSQIWGELTARVQQQGVQLSMGDGLIAATAMRHGLHVVTRSVRHFEPTGVLLINPWE